MITFIQYLEEGKKKFGADKVTGAKLPKAAKPPKGVKAYDAGKEIKAIARERVGSPKPQQVMVPKKLKPQKHKKQDWE